MRRYACILGTITLLGGVYAWLGGFQPAGPADPDDGEPVAAASLQPTLSVDPPADRLREADPAFGGSPPAVTAKTLDAAPAHGAVLAQEGAADAPVPGQPPLGIERITIGRGESFYMALERAGIGHDTIMQLVAACRAHIDLKRVQRGDVFDLTRAPGGALQSVRTELDSAHYLVASAGPDGFNAQLCSYPVERELKAVRGTIDNNLFDALKTAGADPALAVQLSEILGFDIDFFRDLRKGDTFTLLYEGFVHEGRPVRDGRLLAADFVNDGRRHEAYLFENTLGLPAYYDGGGRSLEKQFLRSPLKFDRISSGYSLHRFHPILRYYRPHEGVDYAAPSGTPVRATADGAVLTRDRYRGNGNYIVLRHGAGYESWYLHLSGFAAGILPGRRVQQGDIIGYVGSTGLSTAPHLCYRIMRNGRFVNPQKLELPPSDPVDAARRPDFMRTRDDLRIMLASVPLTTGVTLVMAQAPGATAATLAR
jgi:murein DD-endopeptidase MepM/ murein hydrolase activator NlpD